MPEPKKNMAAQTDAKTATVLMVASVKHDSVLYSEGVTVTADREVLEALAALGAVKTPDDE